MSANHTYVKKENNKNIFHFLQGQYQRLNKSQIRSQHRYRAVTIKANKTTLAKRAHNTQSNSTKKEATKSMHMHIATKPMNRLPESIQ